MMKMLTGLLLFIIFLFACEKDKPIITPPPPPPDPCVVDCDTISEATIKVIWQTPIGKWPFTIEKMIAEDFILDNGNLSYIINFRGPDNVLIHRNLNDGKLIWSWNDPNEVSDGSSITDIESYPGKTILGSWHEVFVIDAQSGTTEWFTDTETTGGKGEPRIGLIGDYIYHSHTDRITDGESVYLVRSSVHTPQWDTLFSVHKSELNGFSPYGEPPFLWIHPSGDSILLYNISLTHFSNSKTDATLYAFNVSQKSMLWKLENYRGALSSKPNIIYEDKIYAFGATSVFCVDALAGEIIWSKQFDNGGENSGFGNITVAENRLIAKTDWHTIYALDLETGEEIWRTENAGTSPSRLQYYDGNVYYSSIGKGKIFGVNVQTGKIVFEHDSPNEEEYHDASFTWAGVQIDAETGYLYTADGYFVMCIDLNE